MNQKRRIKKANIKFLSLCPRGVNRLPVIYKAEGADLAEGAVDFDTLIKASSTFQDDGEITAVVYAPEVRDSQGDIASAEVIKKAMYDAAQNGINLDILHDNKAIPKDKAFIAESFIIQKSDPRFVNMKDYNGAPVNVEGGWAVVVKVQDAELRKAYRDNKWNGISMGGTAAVEVEKSADETAADKVVASLAKLLNTPKEKELNDMTEAEVKKAIEDAQKPILEALAKLTPTAPTTPVVKSETVPVYKGDPMDTAAVKKHARMVRLSILQKSIDYTDPESVKAYTDAVDLAKAEEAAEKAAAEALKGSNQPIGNDGTTGIAKSESEKYTAIGKALAEAAKK